MPGVGFTRAGLSGSGVPRGIEVSWVKRFRWAGMGSTGPGGVFQVQYLKGFS